ncbi:hypothetical protein [Paraglaciecola arctica]|uniref:hypothetical protein n=1 Tax=Paraglaciecola arctica TaxID=1128911 RepID=UPI00209179AF|nr:hypothetical protein [Paraglaciecola arctica]
MISELVDSNLIEEAYLWLCKQRKHFPVNSDVWDVRFHWNKVKPQLIDELLSNQFYFRPLQKVTKSTGEIIHLWTSIDSVVLKLLSLVLQRYLPCSKLCTHLKGHGGSKHTVTEIQRNFGGNTFVFRTDVKSYYESINHEILLDKLSVYIKDKMVMNLLSQYVKRSVESGGLLKDIKKAFHLVAR